jgi:hypothetical protein
MTAADPRNSGQTDDGMGGRRSTLAVCRINHGNLRTGRRKIDLMDEEIKETIDHLRKMVRRSRELALQSQSLRLRSEEVIGQAEILLDDFRER